MAAVSTMDLERFYEFCIKLKSKMSEERDWVCADIFTVNFEETMALKLLDFVIYIYILFLLLEQLLPILFLFFKVSY